MNLRRENAILEETLSIAEEGYGAAYRFLLEKYEERPGDFGPQALYFLACLAGGDGQPERALEWLRIAVLDKGWWYRPEVLEDDDLAELQDKPAFLALKAVSDGRYAEAVSESRAAFSWKGKTADRLFLAVHGNTQNAQVAREDWEAVLAHDPQLAQVAQENRCAASDSDPQNARMVHAASSESTPRWQLEAVQSAEPDGYGSYRWSYDMTSYLPVAEAMEKMAHEGYVHILCGGFSAGCDMLLRAITFSPAGCDALVLQSPWIPMLEEHAEELVQALRQKHIALKIRCGSEDGDCLPMAEQLYAVLHRNGIPAELVVQPGNRHQFPTAQG